MKKSIIVIIAVVIQYVIVPYCAVGGPQYHVAIFLIDRQKYAPAEELLSKVDSTLFFSDAGDIRCYVKIQQNIDDMMEVHYLLEQIPEDYSGKYAAEIKEIRVSNTAEYDEYQKEEERKRQEKIEGYKQQYSSMSAPFVGMDEEAIDYTTVGRHDTFETKKRTSARKTTYTWIYSWYADWYSSGTKSIGLVVECEDGIVTEVIKKDPYWKSDGTPNYSGKPISINTPKRNTTSSSKSTKKSDPYDVYDYDDPEDFYYDNEDDFDGYEDAEDYFYDHR
jgi:hypothetical protein